MSDRWKFELEPADEETLISLMARGCIEVGSSWAYFQRRVFGLTFQSARLAERRYFAWEQLELIFGVSAERLYAMSERSLFVGRQNPAQLSPRQLSYFPWTEEKGYSCYSPAALERAQHWRLSWLLPGNFIDAKTGTLFLRHCPGCRCELKGILWRHPLPICPRCEAELWAAPIIDAPKRIAKWAEGARNRFDLGHPPFNHLSGSVRLLASIFHVAALLEISEFTKLRSSLLREIDLGPPCGEDGPTYDVADNAIRHVQSWAAAEHACATYEEVTWRDGFMEHHLPRNLSFTRHSFTLGLRELAAKRGARRSRTVLLGYD